VPYFLLHTKKTQQPMRTMCVAQYEFLFTISHYKSPINHVQMLLDWLIVVDEISSLFSLDDEGNNDTSGGRHPFVVVKHCFIWQCSVLNYIFARSKGEPTLSIISRYNIFFVLLFPREKSLCNLVNYNNS
jgi:hypothetical protein